MAGPDTMQLPLKRRLRKLRRTVSRSIRSAVGTIRGVDTKNSAIAVRASLPLLFAEKTYNTAHPDYEGELVGNFPDHVHHADRPCSNPLFVEIRKLARRNMVPRRAWPRLHREVMEEASAVPGFRQVMERKQFIETHLAELSRRYQAHYLAGWVDIAEAQFLYWAVRRAKPRTIVQTGVSNGLSSAFMMLALARNGPQGRLYVIDLPAIFDPEDPAWIKRGNVYGVAIPQGKSSGWMVPDIYHDRFEVEIGDAKTLLPPLIGRLDRVDMFFHDSDHTYQHMMFEFEEVKRKLASDGIIVSHDISWNASLWDFADRHHVPSYNYLGALGVAFFSETSAQSN